MRTLIKNVLLENQKVCVLIKDNVFEKIFDTKSLISLVGNTLTYKTEEISQNEIVLDKIIEAENKTILPAFYNLHCHAAMTLLRGYAEDMPLFDWLQKIWQREAELKAEDIYHGTRLAIIEMIKSGTVFFADMYWHSEEVIKAVEEMGIRCDVGVTLMDRLSSKEIERDFDFIRQYNKDKHERISVSPAPHAIYTCSEKLYRQAYETAKETNTFLQTHLAETKKEFDDCQKAHNGLSPLQWLDSIGVMDEKTITAHCVYFTEKDAEIFSKRKSVAVHNPCSNMKLASGIFPMPLMKKYGCKVALGTDGTSSNNNLSMIEEMKMACLLSKVGFLEAEVVSAKEVFEMATRKGAEYYNILSGSIVEGKLADCILVDLDNERMQPLYNIIYNMVYSADSSCVDTVICNGKVLMQNHIIENEKEIIEKAKSYAKV